MSTPCIIFMDTESGPKGVYCHYDGMLENTGLTLYHHYNDEEKVKELIVKGDNSGIQPNIEDMSFYDKHTAYPDNVKNYHHVYLFSNHKWYVKIPKTYFQKCPPVSFYRSEWFLPLEQVLENKHLI